MKQLLTLLLSLATITSLWSQCPTETIVLRTQSDVDGFAQQYPDCTYLETNLYIGVDTYVFLPNCDASGDAIVDLSGLDQLTYIRDTLVIQCNNSLQIMDGFNGLDSIGSMFISGNEALTDILGFENLTKSKSRIRIKENDLLSNIHGFSNLEEAQDIVLTADASIDLSRLESVFYLQIDGDTELEHMDSIRSMTLNVRNNDLFENFDFLSGRAFDFFGFDLNNITRPITCQGLELVKQASISVRGAVDVDFTQLESLTDISLRLIDCEDCDNLKGLENLNYIGVFFLANVPKLTSLEDLGVTSGTLVQVIISDCTNLESIDALAGITTIDFLLQVKNNPNLDDCSIKPICRRVMNGVSVTIKNNGPSNTCNTADQVLMGCTAVETYIDYTICDGDTITLNGTDYTSVGLFYQDLLNEQGLDSILVIDIVASDDCPDPDDNQDLCPLDAEKPGLQINKRDDGLYDVIISYQESSMSIDAVGYESTVKLISCHKSCRDLTFESTTFSFIDHCDMMDDVSRGIEIAFPDANDYNELVYYTCKQEIRYFEEFVVLMAVDECVKM